MLLDIGFHTLSLINSTYPSTIWDKSSARDVRALAKNSVSGSVQVAATARVTLVLDGKRMVKPPLLRQLTCLDSSATVLHYEQLE